MPVVPFHISSASDTARANGTVSDLTLPLTGALQIPDTATPRAWPRPKPRYNSWHNRDRAAGGPGCQPHDWGVLSEYSSYSNS